MNSRLNCRNKAAFSCRISVDGGPNCRNRVTFSNFTGAVWTGPECSRCLSGTQHHHPYRLALEFFLGSMNI